jgi:predicted amidohydrolase YtcJ
VLNYIRSRAAVSKPGEWITLSQVFITRLRDQRFPTRAELDQAAPRNPVCLEAKNGHALWVNSQALKAAGIEPDTADPEGGQIVRGRDGAPSGVLLENAMRLVQAVIPKRTPAELADLMRDAQAAAHSVGLTGIHDFDSTLAFEAFQEMEARGELSLRVVKGIPHEQLSAAISLGLRTGFGSAHLRLGPLKMFADGALGPQTAWMIAPYEGTSSVGIPRLTGEQAEQDVRRANAAGIACAVHAIGDAACRVVLDAFEHAALPAQGTGAPRLRNRVEHVQLLHPDDVSRFARLGIIASMQPLHATSDMLIADRYWGSRCTGAYAWKSLLEAGAALSFGSDCPVEICNPFAGIHAAVTRRRADGSPGPQGWRPEQKLTVEQAVRAYTLGAAYAAGQEAAQGSIEVGKHADLTVLDADIFSMEEAHEIRNVKPAATIVGGRMVFSSL